jgi:hypothetical protein
MFLCPNVEVVHGLKQDKWYSNENNRFSPAYEVMELQQQAGSGDPYGNLRGEQPVT